MSTAVMAPVVEFVENVPVALPPSLNVTSESVQSIIEAFAGPAIQAAPNRSEDKTSKPIFFIERPLKNATENTTDLKRLGVGRKPN
jgi:hypothetical protein